VTRCGYVAVVGRPNVGKSTLINRVLGQKLSITSRRPQTTRNRIIGIKTSAAGQIVLLDTPGIHESQGRALNRSMNRAATGALEGVDLVVMLCEAMRFGRQDEFVLARVVAGAAPVMLVVNKVDMDKNKAELMPFLSSVSARAPFVDVLPISARRARDAARFEQLVLKQLPLSELIYPQDQFTDRPLRFLCAEIIREKLIRQLGDEVPHRLAVQIESFQEHPGAIDIDAAIWVETRGQKAIVIGQAGARLKEVGTQARQDMQRLADQHIRLGLWVKVKSGWSNDPRRLTELGLEE
jgi:GTP-binding protein Era